MRKIKQLKTYLLLLLIIFHFCIEETLFINVCSQFQVGIRSITKEGREQGKRFGVEQYEMCTFSKDREMLENLVSSLSLSNIFFHFSLNILLALTWQLLFIYIGNGISPIHDLSMCGQKLGEGAKGVYISVDVDCLDPAFAPGVSHIEPGGLSFRDVLNILHNLQGDVVAADVVEFNPQRDTVDGMTAMVAAKLVRELTAKISK